MTRVAWIWGAIGGRRLQVVVTFLGRLWKIAWLFWSIAGQYVQIYCYIPSGGHISHRVEASMSFVFDDLHPQNRFLKKTWRSGIPRCFFRLIRFQPIYWNQGKFIEIDPLPVPSAVASRPTHHPPMLGKVTNCAATKPVIHVAATWTENILVSWTELNVLVASPQFSLPVAMVFFVFFSGTSWCLNLLVSLPASVFHSLLSLHGPNFYQPWISPKSC